MDKTLIKSIRLNAHESKILKDIAFELSKTFSMILILYIENQT
jgi:hypothetical protein